MKPKNFVLVTLLVVLVLVGIWWLLKPTAASEEKTAQAPTPAKADAPKPVAQIAQVELPKLPPVAAKGDPTSDAAALTDTDPRTNPNTATADAIRLIETNDMVGYLKAVFPSKYLAMLPRGDTVERLAQEMENPKYKEAIQKNLAALKSIQDQPPILTDDGNTATFETHMDDPLRTEVVLKKVNGLWYIEHI